VARERAHLARGVAEPPAHLGVGAALEQELDHRQVLVPHRVDQRGVAVQRRALVDVGAVVEQ
jgi:hypothetical protein